MRQIILILLAALLVSACGAKGALYLPDKKYPQPKDASQPQDASQPLDNSQPRVQPDTTQQPPQDTHQ